MSGRLRGSDLGLVRWGMKRLKVTIETTSMSPSPFHVHKERPVVPAAVALP
jgi:hypothetical protein